MIEFDTEILDRCSNKIDTLLAAWTRDMPLAIDSMIATADSITATTDRILEKQDGMIIVLDRMIDQMAEVYGSKS